MASTVLGSDVCWTHRALSKLVWVASRIREIDQITLLTFRLRRVLPGSVYVQQCSFADLYINDWEVGRFYDLASPYIAFETRDCLE